MNIKVELENRFRKALAACGAESSPMVGPANRPEFGDYQMSGIMGAAKMLKTNPRKLAEQVVAQTLAGGVADLSDLAEKVEIAGPGFINIRLRPEWIASQVSRMTADELLGLSAPTAKQTVVVDYSAPNLAKEMHVGHLRSTIIGDALARTLEFMGHEVIRQNHVGDWGTQFGMLTAYIAELDNSGGFGGEIKDLEEFYRAAKQKYDSDENFARTAREYVVKLQSGSDERVRREWKHFLGLSMAHCREVYSVLGVSLTDADLRGESAYNDYLPQVIQALQAQGLLSESQGAMCVFLPEFVGKDGEPLPLIVQKSDEGYLYATTDLAAMRFRAGKGKADGAVDWTAQRILYVVDARQSLHFKQVFAVARKAGFVGEGVSLEHISFGTMMGDDGKPFKTRTGGTVKLMDLLTEAEQRAFDLVSRKNPEFPEIQRREIARVVGIGAVKYADLSQNRTSDYVFSWDKMLSFEGNTAPYMQYAYARVRSIFRKGELGDEKAAAGAVEVIQPAERALAVKLLQFPETMEVVACTCMPNAMCNYLYELAGAFMSFYENCPVLQAEEPARTSRLRLSRLTARAIKTGLDLLGISTIEQM